MAIKVIAATADDKPSNAGVYAADARAIFAMVTVAGAAKVDISEEKASYVPMLKLAIKRLDLGMNVEKIRGTSFLYCDMPATVPATALDCDCGFCEVPAVNA